MFNLPGRGFHQRITSTSSVPMTPNDVIVHVRQFVIVLVSVDGCLVFLIEIASLICRILRLGSLSTIFAPSQSMTWFSVVAWSVRADLFMVDINLFFRSLCISLFSCCLHPFCVPPVVFLVVFLSSQCTQPHSSCMEFSTPVHPVLNTLEAEKRIDDYQFMNQIQITTAPRWCRYDASLRPTLRNSDVSYITKHVGRVIRA